MMFINRIVSFQLPLWLRTQVLLAALASSQILRCEPVPDARHAVEIAMPLLQSSARTWFQQRPCSSCHHQGLGMMTVALARERGFRIDEQMLAEQVEKTSNFASEEAFVLADASINEQPSQSYRLLGLGSAGFAANSRTSLMVHMLLGKQHVSGSWSSYSHRPPMEDSSVTATALVIRTVRLFGLSRRSSEIEARIGRARVWLASISPVSTEESAMRLMGLAWAGANSNQLTRAASDLLRRQLPDGGWPQLPDRKGDAYATGQTLVALNQAANITNKNAAFRRGINFLLKTQKPDGTWLVETRRTSNPGLPYFESGFPYGKHQFISYAGTAWATMALILGTGGGTSHVLMANRPQTDAAAGDSASLPSLIREALYGTEESLRQSLSQGGDVNLRWTEAGLTPLMCAIYSPGKVRLLVDAGADVNAKTKSGETALMLAAGYDGAGDTVRLLLDRGADVNAVSTRERVRSAIHMAAVRGDQSVMQLLLERGANVNDLPTGSSALIFAILQRDERTVRYLLGRGALANSQAAMGGLQLAALNAAIYSSSAEIVNLLLSKSASVNEVYPDGSTPLTIAAAAIYTGDTKIIETLLMNGADIRQRTAAGETALTLAEKYGNSRAADLLREAELRNLR
jgi:N-acyl-D-amino-acid deacylase